MNRTQLKEKAKQVFTGRYWLLVGVFAIITAIVGAVAGLSSVGGSSGSGVSAFFNGGQLSEGEAVAAAIILLIFTLVCSVFTILVTIFATNIVSLGGANVGLKAMRGESYGIRDIFSGFKKGVYFRNVGAMALYNLFIALAVLVVIIPAEFFLVLFAILLATKMPVWAFVIVYVLLSLILIFASMVPGFIVQYGLSRVPYLLVDDEEIKPMAAIKKSWRLMVGHKNEYFVLRLSFLGWSLLNVITFGVSGTFWSNPYMNLALAGYHDEVMDAEDALESSLNDGPDVYPEVIE